MPLPRWRTNSFWPNVFSTSSIATEIEGCETFSILAAAVTLPWRATATR